MTRPAEPTPLRMLRHDRSILHERVPRGTARRVVGFVRPYRRVLAVFALVVLADAAVVAFGPLLFRTIIDTAIPARRTGLIAALAAGLAGLAVTDAALTLLQRMIVARVGEGLVCDLRRRLFDHVQTLPLGFFTGTRTGSLVSRLNMDVVGAQTAVTDLLSNVVGGLVFVVIVVAVMATLSWQITLLAVLVLPLLAVPVRLVGRRLAGLTRERYRQGGAMTQLMTERFAVGGALLVKLFGNPDEESRRFAVHTRRIRDLGVEIALIGRFFAVVLALAGALATALVYGIGGIASVHGDLRLGSVVALAAYLARLYGPLSSLAGAPVDVMTALVSFDRVFEVLDLEPGVREAPDAVDSQRGPATLAFRDVSFGYGAAAGDREPSTAEGGALVLHHVDFEIAAGAQVALVGPSGAGKTTIAMLAARLYDVTSGAVVLGGTDVRSLSTRSLRARVGMVTQDSAPLPRHGAREPASGPSGRRRPRAGRGAGQRAACRRRGRTARRSRHRRRRARLPAVRRGEAAPGHRSAAAALAGRRDPRRGDRTPGHRLGVGGAPGAASGTRRAHLAGHRAPPLDRAAGRPRTGADRTAASSSAGRTRNSSNGTGLFARLHRAQFQQDSVEPVSG